MDWRPYHLDKVSFLKTLEVVYQFDTIGPVVSEEMSFEIVIYGRRTDDGVCLYYRLPRSLRHYNVLGFDRLVGLLRIQRHSSSDDVYAREIKQARASKEDKSYV